jgi:putative transposase
MQKNPAKQALSYPIRLPDAAQEDALRLLDISREVINTTVGALWDRLDAFGEHETTYAYKQVTALMNAPVFYGNRLWRCHAEQAGRILRSQAKRKKQFALILPLLEQGMILPKIEKKPARKNRQAIKAALAALREEDSDGGSAVELQNLVEQCCNFYLKNGCFPISMKKCRRFPCSTWVSCRMQQTMAERAARRIGSASIWRGTAATWPFVSPMGRASGQKRGPSLNYGFPCPIRW